MEQQNLNTYGFGNGASTDYAVQRNRVLRNTYWLLALTMVPTVLGAWLGVFLRLPMPSGLIGFVIFTTDTMANQDLMSCRKTLAISTRAQQIP